MKTWNMHMDGVWLGLELKYMNRGSKNGETVLEEGISTTV